MRIVEVAALDFAFEPARWAFAETQAARIAAHWERLKGRKPKLYNGRVLLLARRALDADANGMAVLKGAFFETGYADYVAWRAFGHPGEPVDNCFSMVALQGADGAFLLGEMAPHTFNAGAIYFPAGTPDPSDVFGAKVDLDASARRELLEETGVAADEAASVGKGWTVVFAPQRVACIKRMTLSLPADEVKARIDAFLARDPHAEFSRMHVVSKPGDLDRARTPPFVAAYLRAAWASHTGHLESSQILGA
jgi:8-oxo-dGTP pyrophosphatase MutT (NUDIX family)